MNELSGRIFELLSQHGQRATYSAVAGFLGTEARTLMQGAPRTRLYSWVVNAKTGMPTGYKVGELDPRLLDSDRVISSVGELTDWVKAHTPTRIIMQNRLAVQIDGSTVRIGSHFAFDIQRTLRLPNDGKRYPLPPGYGAFPLHKVDDFKDKVPASWREHGGVFFPMYQREAAWIRFTGERYNPVAVRVAAGKVCAVTGEEWDDRLQSSPQNYMVVGGPAGGQDWLDGFKTGEGVVSQFVAMPLGMGYTVEKQITGKEEHGGLQIAAFGCKPDKRPAPPPPRPSSVLRGAGGFGGASIRSMSTRKSAYGGPGGQSVGSFGGGQGIGSDAVYACNSAEGGSMGFMEEARRGGGDPVGAEMGLAAGGLMDQAIRKDQMGFDCWDVETGGRIFVHIVNSVMYEQITGRKAPTCPITAKTYTTQGYPWYSTYDEDQGRDVAPSEKLGKVKNVAEIDNEKGIEKQQDDTTVYIPGSQVKNLSDPKAVRDGKW